MVWLKFIIHGCRMSPTTVLCVYSISTMCLLIIHESNIKKYDRFKLKRLTHLSYKFHSIHIGHTLNLITNPTYNHNFYQFV